MTLRDLRQSYGVVADERESEDVRERREVRIDRQPHVAEIARDDRGRRHRDPFGNLRYDRLIIRRPGRTAAQPPRPESRHHEMLPAAFPAPPAASRHRRH